MKRMTRCGVVLATTLGLMAGWIIAAPFAAAISPGCTEWEFQSEDYLSSVGSGYPSFEAGDTISIDFETAPPQEPPLPPATWGELKIGPDSESTVVVDSGAAPGTLSYTFPAAFDEVFIVTAFDSSTHIFNIACVPADTALPLRMSALRSPIDPEPFVNVARVRRSVPFRFRVTDGNGDPVTDLAQMQVLFDDTLSCDADAPRDRIEEYTQRVGLHHVGNGRYTLGLVTRWHFPRCWRISITPGFGANERSALFTRRR